MEAKMYQKLIDDLRLTAEAGQTSYIIEKKIGFAITLDRPGLMVQLDNKYYKLFLDKFGTRSPIKRTWGSKKKFNNPMVKLPNLSLIF